MICSFKKNCLGTISFQGKFLKFKKLQEFIVYPMHSGEQTDRLTVQSDTRIGMIRLSDGKVIMSPSRPSGSYGIHLALAEYAGQLSAEELLLLKSNVMATAHGDAGRSINHMIGTDNAGALNVFGATA